MTIGEQLGPSQEDFLARKRMQRHAAQIVEAVLDGIVYPNPHFTNILLARHRNGSLRQLDVLPIQYDGITPRIKETLFYSVLPSETDPGRTDSLHFIRREDGLYIHVKAVSQPSSLNPQPNVSFYIGQREDPRESDWIHGEPAFAMIKKFMIAEGVDIDQYSVGVD